MGGRGRGIGIGGRGVCRLRGRGRDQGTETGKAAGIRIGIGLETWIGKSGGTESAAALRGRGHGRGPGRDLGIEAAVVAATVKFGDVTATTSPEIIDGVNEMVTSIAGETWMVVARSLEGEAHPSASETAMATRGTIGRETTTPATGAATGRNARDRANGPGDGNEIGP